MSSHVGVSIQTCAELVHNFFQFSDIPTRATDIGVLPSSDIPTWAAGTVIVAGWNQIFHIACRTLHNTRVIEWFIWLRSKVVATFTRSGHVPTLTFTDTASVQILKATSKVYKLLMPKRTGMLYHLHKLGLVQNSRMSLNFTAHKQQNLHPMIWRTWQSYFNLQVNVLR